MKYDELALALYFLAAYGAFELLWALARIESVRPPSLRRAKAPLALAWGMLARLGADRLLLQVPVTGGIALAEPSTIAMALTILLGLGMTLSLAKAPSRSGMSGKAARALLGLASVFVLALIMGIAVSSLRGTGIAGAADTAIVFAAAFLLALSKLPLSGPMALLAFSAVPLAHVHYGYLFAALGLAVLAGFALRARGLDKPFFSRGDGSQATLFIASAVAALMLRLGALPPLAGLTAGVVAFSVVPFHAPGAGTGMQLAAFCAGAIALGAGPWEHPLELPTVFFLALAFHSVRKLAFGPDEKRSDAAPFGVLGAAAGFGAVGGAGVISYALARLLLALLPSRGDRLGEAKDPTEGMRVIAAIGKRENVLGILGFAQALECRPNPVRAVCVAAPKGSPGQDPLEAEEALVRVIAAGTQAGIQVLPSLVLASSPADGLARAALERNAEAFVLGWPSMTPGGEIDRPTLDQLAGSTRKAIFVVRNADLFAPSRRLIVAYPSTNESAPGFIPCTTTLERVWKTMSNPGYVAIGSEQSGRESLPGWRELVDRKSVV